MIPSPVPINATLICSTSGGDPGPGKVYSLSLKAEPDGSWTTDTRWGPASANPLPNSKAIASKVKYEDALREFFLKYEEKLTQKPDTYKVKTESIPPPVREYAETTILTTLPKTMARTRKPENWLFDQLNDTIAPSLDRKMPVLLDGPPGSGKTYTTREFGLKAGFTGVFEVAGHSGIESMDLLGSFLPDGSGKLVWVDGPVTAAYRAASEGRKALLLIDEIYRIPTRHRNILLNALIPHNLGGDDDFYMLRAGRVKPGSEKAGVASTEMIAAPVKNLSIVATTNIGSSYGDVEVDDPAMKERWHIIHVKMEEKAQKAILLQQCSKLKLPPVFADVALELSKATNTLKQDDSLESTLSPRLTIRLLNLIRDPSKDGFVKAARSMVPALVGRDPDGNLQKEHEDAYVKAIDMTSSKLMAATTGGAKV